jgi:DsbC/DsbD-like thiol-disulfide interchange protein
LLKTKIVAVFLLLLGLTSCAKETPPTANTPANTEQKRNSKDLVKVQPHPVDAMRNQTVDAIVDVTIENGYHVNANPPTFPYLKPTELLMDPAQGVSVAFIVYPDALTKTFSFEEKPLSVYEGTIPIKVKLKIEKSAPIGKQTLSAKLNVQACDDQVCYAPGTLDVSIPVDIK